MYVQFGHGRSMIGEQTHMVFAHTSRQMQHAKTLATQCQLALGALDCRPRAAVLVVLAHTMLQHASESHTCLHTIASTPDVPIHTSAHISCPNLHRMGTVEHTREQFK
jgi:hypothetical protein